MCIDTEPRLRPEGVGRVELVGAPVGFVRLDDDGGVKLGSHERVDDTLEPLQLVLLRGAELGRRTSRRKRTSE